MKIPTEIKCVIFDMDGVIIDSEEIHKKAYYETFTSIGVDVSDELYKSLTGSSLVLASSSAMVNIDRVFNRFNLNPYFTAKISGADLTASKPHPEIFEKAALLGKTSKENCIVIEDSDNGIKAANDAGIFVFGYKNPMAADQTLKNADLIIEDFSELQKII